MQICACTNTREGGDNMEEQLFQSIVNDLLSINGLGEVGISYIHMINSTQQQYSATITRTKRVLPSVDTNALTHKTSFIYNSFRYSLVPGLITITMYFPNEKALLKHQSRLHEVVTRDIKNVTDIIDTTVETTLEVLIKTIELKDQHTANHSLGVASLGRDFAEWLLANDSLTLLSAYDPLWKIVLDNNRFSETVYIMGLLHDIGKLGIPEYILDKPGALNKDEFRIIRQHPVYSKEIVLKNPIFSELSAGIGAHHENWNGTGYPDGLTRTAIPLGGRLLAIIDRFDAIMRPRIYKRAASVENALHILNLDIETFSGDDNAVLDPYIGIEFMRYVMLDSPYFAKQRATMNSNVSSVLLRKRDQLLASLQS